MTDRPGEIVLEHAGSARVVSLHGDHDVSTAPDLERALDQAILDDVDLIIDLSACTFLDSAGVAVLFRARQRTHAGFVAVVEPASAMSLSRLLDLVRFSSVIPVYDSRDAAAGALTG